MKKKDVEVKMHSSNFILNPSNPTQELEIQHRIR